MKPRTMADGSIMYPNRGVIPKAPEGYIQDPNDPYHFYQEEHHAKKFRKYSDEEKLAHIRTVKLHCLSCSNNPRKLFSDEGTTREHSFCTKCKTCGTSTVSLLWIHCPINKFKSILGD
jgi:hypothetical protein